MYRYLSIWHRTGKTISSLVSQVEISIGGRSKMKRLIIFVWIIRILHLFILCTEITTTDRNICMIQGLCKKGEF